MIQIQSEKYGNCYYRNYACKAFVFAFRTRKYIIIRACYNTFSTHIQNIDKEG